MPKYTCTKCALTAHSKNAATRNVFPNDEHYHAWSISSYTAAEIEPDRYNDKRRDMVLRITLPWVDLGGFALVPETLEAALTRYFKFVGGLAKDEQKLKIAVCALTGHCWHTDEEPEA